MAASVFKDLLELADPKSGIVQTNATIQAAELSLPVRYIQDAHWKLRQGKYIHYERAQGQRGPHEIYIHKYPCRITRRNEGEPGVWYSNIWHPDGRFIGPSLFLGRLKCADIPSICQMSDVVCAVVSISGFGLPAQFKIDFRAQFGEYIQAIDLLGHNDLFCEWLAQFEGDFTGDYAGEFRGEPIYINILYHQYSNYFKDTKKPSEREKQRLAELTANLKHINHGFKPDMAIGWAIKERYRPDQIITALEALERRQKKDPVKNGFGYYKATLENLALKGLSLNDLKNVKVIDGN